MKYNIATIEYVLSSKFINECVALARKTTLDDVAIRLQYAYNAKHDFNRILLAKPELNVSIYKADVERALALHHGRVAKTDEIGLVYNWLMTNLSMMIQPTVDKAWAKFVNFAKAADLMKQFAHLNANEVYRLFQAVYSVAEVKAVTCFYL